MSEDLRRSAGFWTCAIVFSFYADTVVLGQSFQGGLRGAMKDSGGAIVPGVSVTLVNEATNISRDTVSNAVGEYVFAAVTPGTYTLRAVIEGFKTVERKGLTIGTQQFITLDLVMELGTIEEQVTVTGNAPLIETSNASIGQVLDNKTLEALPALNRNAFMSAVTTVPTVLAQGDPYFSRLEDQVNGSLVSLGGGPLRANNYLLDGVSITDLQNRTTTFVTPEAIGELKVQVHTYDAEMGRSGGGVFNTTGRSGTNAFRGSGFSQFRPNWSASRNYFDQLAGRPKPSEPYYRYWGGSIGGPIKRNKTFFYFADEGYMTNSARTGLLLLPTERELQGDFSQTFDRTGRLILIYDPLTTRQLPDGTFTRDPFPNNTIPANRISTVARNIAGFLPKPDSQVSAASGLANKQVTVPVPTWANQTYTKVEHKVNERDTVTGLFLATPDNEHASRFWQQRNRFADPGEGTEIRRVYVVALNNLFIPNETTVVSLRYGWTRFHDNQIPFSGYNLASLGFPASFVNDVTFEKFPAGVIEGYSSFGNRAVQRNKYKSWAANGSVSKLLGRQTIKFGADYRQLGVEVAGTDQSSGSFNFAKVWTQQDPNRANALQGNGFASFLLGIPTGTTPVVTPLDFSVRYYAGYLQDDFRISGNVTLNAGIRYEYETGMGEAQNRITVAFDKDAVNPLSTLTGLNLRGGLIYAGQNGAPTHQGNGSKTKFSPRAGFTWALNRDTVVRSGYGLYWSPWLYTAPGTSNYGQTGYTAQNEIFHASDVVPTVSLDNPYPNGLAAPSGNTLGLLTGTGGVVQYASQDRKSPYVQQYSAEIQRELPGEIAVSVAYIGARGDNLSYGFGNNGATAAAININTLTQQQLALGTALQNQVPNPFFGIAQAGPFSRSPTTALGQLLRPFPQFGDVLELQSSGARTRYNAVAVETKKRLSHNVGGSVSYTWSRLDDDQFNQGSYYDPNRQSRPLDPRNLAAEYSRSMLDVPHRIVASPIVELPFGRNQAWLKGGVGNALAGSWTLSAIITFDSGAPINVTQTDNTGSFGGVQRPNLTGVDPVTSGDTLDRLNGYINPAAYSLAAPFTLGTASRTNPDLRVPARTNLDLVFSKRVPLKGSVRGTFRLEFLNATNTPKFVGPASIFGVSTFGTITTQAGFARITQFMFRVDW